MRWDSHDEPEEAPILFASSFGGPDIDGSAERNRRADLGEARSCTRNVSDLNATSSRSDAPVMHMKMQVVSMVVHRATGPPL